jgi:hypothetical protein
MKRYLMLVLFVAMVGGLAEWILPEDRNEEMRRPIRLVAALCLLGVLLTPLGTLPQALDRLSEELASLCDPAEQESAFDEPFRVGMTALEVSEAARLLSDRLGVRLGVDAGSFTVTLARSPEQLAVAVRLRGRALLLDPAAVEEAVLDLLDGGCVCTVYY